MSHAASPLPPTSGSPKLPSRPWLLFLVVLAVTAATEWIGPMAIPVWSASIVILPMLVALLATTLLAVWHARLPAALRLGLPLQAYAGKLLDTALLLFIVKLGLMAGANMQALREVGWALAFQELGHAFGTMVLALPLALLLGIKREAVGATFSIGRETAMVIIGQKYGMQSAEGRGVLAEYITGTVLGAVFISLLASVIASLGIFDPRSLAMGAGIGSGSMMAAALGPITLGQSPELARELTAIAGAANLIAGVVGFYFAAFVTLPLCNWLYGRLEPVLGRTALARRAPSTGDLDTDAVLEGENARSTFADSVLALLLMVAGITISNWIGHGVGPAQTLPGVAVMVAIVLLGLLLKRLLRKLPLMLFLALAATFATLQGGWPLAGQVAGIINQVQFMSITTTVLALAGFSVARKLPMFRRLGWRIVLVSLTAATGAFIGSATVAEIFH
ncbi:DUF3100 domain-containing protein [Luteimonas sp. BDR2-5]|uniref:DUF3100 domain-containing protein n=1 Tax=Proluteimonas luteida TaxID=2878685 RepID=UPI001E656BE3|nr:DUF3100 domain-containing protein [Luteimonas sp. BDR2-5]MCD9030087.1 DUF3100 domain-containing protein [Luteimonas sp. BDR2-5]